MLMKEKNIEENRKKEKLFKNDHRKTSINFWNQNKNKCKEKLVKILWICFLWSGCN